MCDMGLIMIACFNDINFVVYENFRLTVMNMADKGSWFINGLSIYLSQ